MDATVIAVVSVVVTGATATAAPLIAARANTRQVEQAFRHERLNRDFDELRALLDEIAAAIPLYIHAVSSMESRHSTANTTEFAHFTEYLSSATAARETSRRLYARLIIRLGRNHEVASALASVLSLLDDAGGEVMAAIGLERPATPGQKGQRPYGRRRWYEAEKAFLDAASDLVGSPVRQPEGA